MKLRALVLALALAACGQQPGGQTATPQSETPDPFTLNIEVGRYGVMLDQVENLTRETPDAAETEVTDPKDLARRLRETVWAYNIERSSLCARGLYTAVTCGPSYQPVWIAEAPDSAPSLDELQLRSNALGEEIMRFWDAVCEQARTAETDEEARQYVCAIE